MAEIAILRRIREDREREQMRHAARVGACERAALLCGRAIFGGYFLYNGMNHLMNRQAMSAYASSKRVPYPDVAVVGTGAMLVLGALGILTGVRPKIGTSLIGAFLLGVTPKMHDFWNVQDAQQRMGEQTNFLKNLGLLGGTLIASAVPEPWPSSLPLAR